MACLQKASSYPNSRKKYSISGPWSFEWIKDHHLGDVGVIFTHNEKNKVIQKQHHKGVPKSQMHIPSLVSLRRVARMPLKDRQALLRMFRKYKKKKTTNSLNKGSAVNLDSMGTNTSSSTSSVGDWQNWVMLHDKTDGGGRDIVDIGNLMVSALICFKFYLGQVTLVGR
jgi:hypothetical protein